MQLGIIVKICLQQNSTTQMFKFVQCILWISFVNLGEYKTGCTKDISKKKKG